MEKIVRSQKSGSYSRDYSISFVRCIATIIIVVCHYLSYYNIKYANWFNVGVQIFLFMSGWLYGFKVKEKQIDDWLFVKKNFFKILLPYWTFLLFVIPLYFIFASDTINIITTYKTFFGVGRIYGLEHLWFISYILFCYLLTPLLNSFSIHNVFGNPKSLLKILAFVVIYFCASEAINLYFNSFWIICYILGYFIAIVR